jgi:preprotein translocase subunit YajC
MLNAILLQAQSVPGNNLLEMVMLFAIVGVVFYFFTIRPQQRRTKKHKSFLDTLRKGDMVVTIGGMHGKVVEINKDFVVLDVDRGTKLTFERSAISVEASKRFAPKEETKEKVA